MMKRTYFKLSSSSKTVSSVLQVYTVKVCLHEALNYSALYLVCRVGPEVGEKYMFALYSFCSLSNINS